MLAEERLEHFADRVQTRILDGKQAGVKSSHAGNQQDKYSKFLRTHEKAFQAFLHHSGGQILVLSKVCAAISKGSCFCRSG